jgi:hypothetical protein
MSTIYLIHFDPPYKHARHYIGFTANDVLARLDEHRAKRGARITQVAVGAGCQLLLVRAWVNVERCYERILKNRHNAPQMCPVCNPRRWRTRGSWKTRGKP